ncbi:phosphopyruvate hydratase [Candidatus Thorarchaeota archaeon]|nr:MAG: phosphopyruvate hydratase [Candidatus Thorarchaeota archaeon]
MVDISGIRAIEILDSRGNPTIMTRVTLSDGTRGVAKVPSGASTGIHEAVELRDGGERYSGKGVTQAVRNVNSVLAEVMRTVDPLSQNSVDEALLKADPTKGKGKLGANAILSVSMATAVAAAGHLNMELFQYLRAKVLEKPTKYLLPVPMSNVINGGAHAGNSLAIQEFMVLPIGAKNFPEALRCISEVYHALGKRLIKKHGRMSKHIGDEGGYCGYGLKSTSDAFDEIVWATEEAGYTPGKDVVLGIDAAASGFYKDGKYDIDGKKLAPSELLDFYVELEKSYPLQTVEDPFEEEAFDDFAAYMKKTKVQLVTDDLTVSNPEIVKRAIKDKAGNALLLKVNQIGTVTEAIEAAKIANDATWGVVVSHRSGETGDTFISDLATALSNGQIKTGAPARSDRVEKYNRLLEIYDILEGKCDYPGADFHSAWRKY